MSIGTKTFYYLSIDALASRELLEDELYCNPSSSNNGFSHHDFGSEMTIVSGIDASFPLTYSAAS